MKTQINVKDAISRAGGAIRIAAHFDIEPVSVYEWIKRGRVPADRCPEIEKLSAGVVRCEELNDGVDWMYVRSTKPKRKTDAPH